ncbi:hypothetical protein [Pseudomonas sp. ESBL2]|uniref:hypothetical protein n=1 Tax=Pseudomonas sp. ESBL2 TaxID=3077325 RepID=UPI00261A7A11|nr:hypothetical protein [uncultured Pseudomonas sp.]
MSEFDQLYSVVNDYALCAAIAASQPRLVYIAPSISGPVAEAIDNLLPEPTHRQ